MDTAIQNLVAATLTELGLPTPINLIQTMLMRDGYFFGHKFRYDGGHAILQADGNTIDFYDEKGMLLNAIMLETEREAA
jgi:hypothetical protein